MGVVTVVTHSIIGRVGAEPKLCLSRFGHLDSLNSPDVQKVQFRDFLVNLVIAVHVIGWLLYLIIANHMTQELLYLVIPSLFVYCCVHCLIQPQPHLAAGTTFTLFYLIYMGVVNLLALGTFDITSQ